MITQEQLKSRLHYDRETGKFSWIKILNPRWANKERVGWINDSGYWIVGLFGGQYRLHRLAWLYVYGYFPKEEIDHINGDRTDNRLCNLREANRAQNSRNLKRKTSNTSGYIGVCFCKSTGRYVVHIRINGIKKNLGRRKDIREAARLYNEFARKHHGEFAKLNEGV